MNILTLKQLLIWVGLFLCLLVAQVLIYPMPSETGSISASKISLVRNAAVPIFLSENQTAAIRQLENLIQDTDIEQVRIFSSDQKVVAQVLNSRAPQASKANMIESFPVNFQGTLAGTIQLEVIDQTPETSRISMLIPASAISFFITLAAWLMSVFYQLFSKRLISISDDRLTQPEVITLDNQTGISEGSSILLYIFPSAEPDLYKNKDAKRNIYAGLFQRLEGHLQIYGGRTLSLTSNTMICRLPSGRPSLDIQQALVFAWGASQPLIFKYKGQQFQIHCHTLVHKTQTAAKTGNLFRALSEIDQQTQQRVQTGSPGARVTESMLKELRSSVDFEYKRCKEDAALFRITSINRALEMLWDRQSRNLSG